MKKLIWIIPVLALGIMVNAQRLETTIKVVDGNARIAVKAVGGDINGVPSGTTFCIAIPAANKSATLDYPTILDASRLPLSSSLITGNYQDGAYKYFMLLWAGANSPVTFAENTEYELLELTWGGPQQSFPVSLISLAKGNELAPVLPYQWDNYLETGGNQYSSGDRLFYQSATSTPPVQMAKDYSSGTAIVTTTVTVNGKPGAVREEKIIALSINGLYPNPARNLVNVMINAPGHDNVTLVVTDMTGKKVKQQSVNVEAGPNTIPVEISKLPSGSYLIKLLCQSSDCETTAGKFNKQ